MLFSSRHIYWCSASNGGHKIEEARLDGKERRTVIDNLGHVTSLVLDYENNWIFFADSLVHTIERVDFKGNNRKRLLSDVPNPQALTLYSSSIYFGDWFTKSVGRADKNTGQNRTKILDNLEFVMDLVTYHKSRQTGKKTIFCLFEHLPVRYLLHFCYALHQGSPNYVPDAALEAFLYRTRRLSCLRKKVGKFIRILPK